MLTADKILLYAALAVGVLLLVEGVFQLVVDVAAGPRAQIEDEASADKPALASRNECAAVLRGN